MSVKSTLRKAEEENRIVSVYVDSDDWSQYSVGYIDHVDDTHVCIRALSRHGEPAGYEVRLISEITKIEMDGKYEKKIEKLSNNQGKIFSEVPLKLSTKSRIIRNSLEQSLKGSVVITVWGQDAEDSLVGYVEKLESGSVSLRLIDEFGEDDGVAILQVSEISSLDFNTQSEQIRKFLHTGIKW